MFLLQTSVFRFFSFGGIVPNLLIMITCIYGFMRGEHDGLLTGFFCGLLMDIFYMDVLGFYALIYMYIGFLCGMSHKLFYKQDFKLPIIAIILGDLSYSFINFLFFYLLNGNFNVRFYATSILLPELFYTLGVSIVFYPLLILLEFKFITVPWKKREKDTQK